MEGNRGSSLTRAEIRQAFSDPQWSERFPPVLSMPQAAELLQVPIGTIYQWRSRGLLDCCSKRVGKHVRFLRDRLIQQVFNEGLNP